MLHSRVLQIPRHVTCFRSREFQFPVRLAPPAIVTLLRGLLIPLTLSRTFTIECNWKDVNSSPVFNLFLVTWCQAMEEFKFPLVRTSTWPCAGVRYYWLRHHVIWRPRHVPSCELPRQFHLHSVFYLSNNDTLSRAWNSSTSLVF